MRSAPSAKSLKNSIFPSTCCGLGDAVRPDQADEARRRAASPPRRRRPAQGRPRLLYGEGSPSAGPAVLQEPGVDRCRALLVRLSPSPSARSRRPSVSACRSLTMARHRLSTPTTRITSPKKESLPLVDTDDDALCCRSSRPSRDLRTPTAASRAGTAGSRRLPDWWITP